MTDKLLHEANRRRAQVVDATRAFVWGMEHGPYFDMQAGYDEVLKSLARLDEVEKRMEMEATR